MTCAWGGSFHWARGAKKANCLESIPFWQRHVSQGWHLGRRCPWEGDIPGKMMFLGRRHPQEDMVPGKEMFPGRCSPGRCPQEADVFGKEMSLERRHPWEGVSPRKATSPEKRCPQQRDVPGKVSPAGRCPWEEDVPGKKTSPGRRTSPLQAAQSIPPCPAWSWGHVNGPQPKEPAAVTATGTQPPLGSKAASREGGRGRRAGGKQRLPSPGSH